MPNYLTDLEYSYGYVLGTDCSNITEIDTFLCKDLLDWLMSPEKDDIDALLTAAIEEYENNNKCTEKGSDSASVPGLNDGSSSPTSSSHPRAAVSSRPFALVKTEAEIQAAKVKGVPKNAGGHEILLELVGCIEKLSHSDFKASLDAEMKRLQSEGIGSCKRQAEVITEEEEILWQKGLPGDATPQVLLDMMVFYNSLYFALRSGNEYRQVKSFPDGTGGASG